MTRHFGVLIPSTNTTVEIECRLLPASYQAHVGRLMTSTPGRTFSPSRDEDIDYQSRLLGTAKVELVILAQTSASLFADDYDEVVTRRMSAGAGVPAITSAQAVGRAVRALGARRIAVVSPYSDEVNERAGRYFAAKHGLEAVALEGFGATNSYAIGQLGPENARNAFARIDRPEIEVFVVPGGNFPTMTSIAAWEREFGKPVVTTNQASFWAMLQMLQNRRPRPRFWPPARRSAAPSLALPRLRGREGLTVRVVVGEDHRRDEGPGLDEFGPVGLAAELLHRTQQAEPVQHFVLAAVLDLVGRVVVPGRVVALFERVVEPAVRRDIGP